MTIPGTFAADLGVLFKRKLGGWESLGELRLRIGEVHPSLGVLVPVHSVYGLSPLPSLTSFFFFFPFFKKNRINSSRQHVLLCLFSFQLLVVVLSSSFGHRKICVQSSVFLLL